MIPVESDNILITGANGWLGLNVLARLHELKQRQPNLRVRALIHPSERPDLPPKLYPGLSMIAGDVRRLEDMRRFCQDAAGSLVLHTVGIIHPRRPREFAEVNVQGTKNLVQAATEAGAKRIVALSSNSPCGCNPHPDHLFDENSPYHPYLRYGLSKMNMELFLKQTQQEGRIETVIIRAPWFYGPYHPPRQTLFFHMVRDGKAPLVGNGRNLRSMANTSRLAEGLLLAGAAKQANGQTYWLADERPYSMIEIIDTIERLLETEFGMACTHKRLRLPGLASEIAYGADKLLQSAGLYHQKIHVLSEMNKTIACSVEKAKRELGFKPATSLEPGMRESMRICFGSTPLPA